MTGLVSPEDVQTTDTETLLPVKLTPGQDRFGEFWHVEVQLSENRWVGTHKQTYKEALDWAYEWRQRGLS